MLGYCFIYPTDETTIAVAFIAYKAAIKEAIIKIQLTTQRMSNKTAIGSISIDRTFEGYRRLAVVELNHTILIHLAYYTATEFRTRTDSTGDSQVFEPRVSNIAEGSRIFLCILVMNGQRIAITIEGAFVKFIRRSHHSLTLAEVDIGGKDGMESVLTAIDTLGKALPVGSITDDESAFFISLRTAEVEGKVRLMYIVVPLGCAPGDGGIVDAKKTQDGRNLHLGIFRSGRPAPQGGSLTAHAIADGLALIAVEHGAVQDFIVDLFTFIQLLADGYPRGIVGVGAARHVALDVEQVVLHDVTPFRQIHLPLHCHLAIGAHRRRQRGGGMEHGDFNRIRRKLAVNFRAIAGYRMPLQDDTRIGAVHGYVDIARKTAGLHPFNRHTTCGTVNQAQLGIGQALQLGVPGNRDVAGTTLVERQHGVHQRDAGSNRLGAVIVLEIVFDLITDIAVIISELHTHLQQLATPMIGHLPANLRRMVVVIVGIPFQHIAH